MQEIKNFHCMPTDEVNILPEELKKLNLIFPDVHFNHDSMIRLAELYKSKYKAKFCTLPFCHTVEGDALDGVINYGDDIIGPRAGNVYRCTSMEEVLDLPKIDYYKGRIHEVLLACKGLHEKGEVVLLEVTGPFTILDVLIDKKHVFKAMRKQPDIMKQVLDKLQEEILQYIKEAINHRVSIISYADPSGALNILGPKLMQQIVEQFTYGFLKKSDQIIKGKSIVLLCPKTSYSLIGTGKAEWKDVDLESEISYAEACVELIGKESFAGQMCIKNKSYILQNKKIKAVKLL